MNQTQMVDLRKHIANWHQLLLDGLKNRHEIQLGRPISGAEWFQFLISAPQFSSALQWNSLIADVDTLLESDPEASHVLEAFKVVGHFVHQVAQDSKEKSIIVHLNQTDSEMRLEWQRISKQLGIYLADHGLTEEMISEMRSAWRTRQALKKPMKFKIKN